MKKGHNPYRRRLQGFPAGDDRNGYFEIPHPTDRDIKFACISSQFGDWEHVSVSMVREAGVGRFTVDRCPTWDEMCHVKDVFWDPEEEVIQYHPRASEYVDECEFCLHLWRPTRIQLPRPDPMLIGRTRKFSPAHRQEAGEKKLQGKNQQQ